MTSAPWIHSKNLVCSLLNPESFILFKKDPGGFIPPVNEI